MVQPQRVEGRIIAPRFLDAKGDDEFKVVSFSAKRARGAMAGWIVRERINGPGKLTTFDGLGYRHDPSRSEPDAPAFIRRLEG
ncbi:MAG: peroxide stress protein YaaA [Ilumatobacteraceae bacterium]